ncbi:MAG: dihydroneopterin aldolase [Sulfuricurvum sp.]|nr:dihydroneopterin aldolase [Sulfuricurvum sp.]
MKILIENLEFETILGILPHERIKTQKIRVNCTIEYPYSSNHFINYADVATHIETNMHEKQFELIEEAIDFLSTSLKSEFSLIQTLTLSIRKPDILPNCTVGVEQLYRF